MALSARHGGADPARPALTLPSLAIPSPGPLLVALGGVVALAGLWAPWFQLTLPRAFFQQAVGQIPADAPPGLAALMQGYATQMDAVAASGALRFSAWQALERVDLLIAALALLAVVAVVLHRMGQLLRFPAEAVAGLGMAIAATVVLRALVFKPARGEYLHVRWGVWLTLLAALVVVAGAELARRESPPA